MVIGLAVPPAQAAHDIVINEILASWEGDDQIQFVELEMMESDQNEIAGGSLEIYDQAGHHLESVVFPRDIASNEVGTRILVATDELQELADLPADFILPTMDPPVIRPEGGRICYRAPESSDAPGQQVDCVAWGNSRSTTKSKFGRPTRVTPDNRSLIRIKYRGRNAIDFRGSLSPTPQNSLRERTELDTSCGDEARDPWEVCDGGDLDAHSCSEQGFWAGTLQCSQCHLDVSGCHNCGNGEIGPGEECDGGNLDEATCSELGYVGGVLRCTPGCTFDTSGCLAPRLPGGGTRADCLHEWHVYTGAQIDHPVAQSCNDGDAACDFDDGVPNSCTFHVQICFNDDYLGATECRARDVGSFRLRMPRGDQSKGLDSENAARIYRAVTPVGGTKGDNGIIFSPPVVTGHTCSEVAKVVVPLEARAGKSPKPGTVAFNTVVTDLTGRRRDTDRIELECLPR